MVGDAQRGNPFHPLGKLVAARLLVVGEVKIDRDDQGQAAEHGADEFNGPRMFRPGMDRITSRPIGAAEQQRR
jgi:hypothetical protein